jgi:Tol biopolymer transport system component
MGLLVVAAPAATGQPILRTVGQPEVLVLANDGPLQHPRWSPEGSRLAFTSERYEGLWIADDDGGNVVQVSDEPSAGFGFTWSPDGTAILARVARYDGPRRSDAVKLFDVERAETRLLTDFRSNMPVLPIWTNDGAHVLLPMEQSLAVLPAYTTAAKAPSADPVFVIRGDQVATARADTEDSSVILSIPEGQPINLVQSPDGSRAAFEIVGDNLFVVSADGSVVDLGRGYRPQWSPDGEWIVYQVTEDDGYEITASDLYAGRIDGSATVRLTDTSEALEMNPSWSPDGARIAFDDRGVIYQIQVSYQ